jgi:basic amino acid/polyamine antiporter, APA family
MAELARRIGLVGAVGMGLGSILGTGVFVSLGLAAGVAGPAMLAAVALAAVVATANGLSSAQLAAAHPVSGGTYAYGLRYIGPTVGFVAGALFLLAKSASAATAALGASSYALHLAGVADPGWGRTGLAAGLALGTTALVAGGVQRSNAVNLAITAVTLAALAAVAATGLSRASVDGIASLAAAAPPALAADPASFAYATALLFVAYTGYGRIATLGEEVRDPARVIPRAVIATLAVAAALYVAVSAGALLGVGSEAFAAATRAGGAPLATVARAMGAPWVAALVTVGAVTAMTAVLLNLVLGLSRVALAMARSGDLPVALALVTEGSRSPARAVWAVGLTTTSLTLLGDLETTWAFSAFTVLVYYGITNVAALRLPAADRRYPALVAWVGLASCAGLAAFVPWRTALAGVGLVALALAARAALRWARHPGGRAG